jgi:hypothetical protein
VVTCFGTELCPWQYICYLYLLCRLDINLLLILGFVDSSGDKSKRSVVEIKGRFSVTSENVDLAKVSELGGYTIEHKHYSLLKLSRKFLGVNFINLYFAGSGRST